MSNVRLNKLQQFVIWKDKQEYLVKVGKLKQLPNFSQKNTEIDTPKKNKVYIKTDET